MIRPEDGDQLTQRQQLILKAQLRKSTGTHDARNESFFPSCFLFFLPGENRFPNSANVVRSHFFCCLMG
jgi:hypothetical protein